MRKLRAVRRPAIFAAPWKYRGQCRTGVFLFGSAPLRHCGPVKGKSPRELISPTAICRAGPATPYVTFLTDQGVGWLATKLFHIHTLHGFFNLSTWLTAIAGAAILLLIFHLVTSRRSTSGRRRTSWAHR